jgi:hypothetical protein
MGKILCYRIHAINTSKFGVSSADFYYSYKYGIVKLIYLPLDKTKIEFEQVCTFNSREIFNTMLPNNKDENDTQNLFMKLSDFR